MDPIITVKRNDTGRGWLTRLDVEDRNAHVLTDSVLTTDPKFGSVVKPVDVAYAAMTESIATDHRNGHIGPALDVEIERQFASFKPVLHYAIQQTREIRANLTVRKARTLALMPDTEPNPHLRSDFRRFFISKDLPSRIELALNSDYAMAAAVFEGGKALSGLPAESWDMFESHWFALSHMKKSGLDSGFEIKSTPEYITGAGVDIAAAYAAAVDAVKSFNRESELLELAESYFQSLVSALMHLTKLSAAEILGLA